MESDQYKDWPMSDTKDWTLIHAAERILLGQYEMTTQGKDAEKAAKDRYDVASAYIQLNSAVRLAIDYANGHESEWGERAEECFRILERAVAIDRGNR